MKKAFLCSQLEPRAKAAAPSIPRVENEPGLNGMQVEALELLLRGVPLMVFRGYGSATDRMLGGFHALTIQSLIRRGFMVKVQDGYEITSAGRHALGSATQ